MALLAVKVVTLAGLLDVAPVAVAASDTFENQGQVVFLVDNQDASPSTFTFDSTKLCDQGSDHNIVGVVAAGDIAIFGPFPVTRFGDIVTVTNTNQTTMFAMPLRISV